MCDNQRQTSSSSSTTSSDTSSNTGIHSDPSTSSSSPSSSTSSFLKPQQEKLQSKMGVENKLSSSSREMRNMAEKMRRDKLNNYVSEIAGIVPLGSGGNKRIDKTSVLRLAANYIRMHKILKDDEDTSNKVPENFGSSITNSLAEAVGGFLLVVTSSGKVVYITEAVDQFFGHTQVDMLGHSIYNVIHPDDHEIFQQQLLPKDGSCRRSFFCRMMEKALSRNDPGRYEIIHVVGQLRQLPQGQQVPLSPLSIASPSAMSPGETSHSSDHDEEDSSDNDEMRPLKMTSRTGSHILVSFVRVVKDRPITELSLVESTQDEYITRHGMDGKILYTDHRISFVTGLMPSEVVGTSAFHYMHKDDFMWSIVAQKLMFTSTQGQGIVSYRLKCKDGAHVTLRSRGFLEVNKQTGQVESFVCINTVLSMKEASTEIKNQRRKLLPVVACHDTEDHLGSISSSLPPELLMMVKQVMNPETIQKMIESVTKNDMLPSESSAQLEDLPVERGTSLTSLPEISPDQDISHSFQTKPKRHCSETRDMNVSDVGVSDEWLPVLKKKSRMDEFNTPASRNFTFKPDSQASQSLQEKCNTFDPHFSPLSPQSSLSPTTSLVPEVQNYPSSVTDKNYDGSSVYPSDVSGQCFNVKRSFDQREMQDAYQNIDRTSQSQCMTEIIPTRMSDVPPEKIKSRTYQTLPSPPGYSQHMAGSVTQDKSNASYAASQQRVKSCSVSPVGINYDTQGTFSSGNSYPNKCNVLSPCSSQNQGIEIYNQSTNTGIPSSPCSYYQNTSQGISSKRTESRSGSRDYMQSESRNVSCNMPSPGNQTPLSYNQYCQQSPPSVSYASMQLQYQPPLPQGQSFTPAQQASHYSPTQYPESPSGATQPSPCRRSLSMDQYPGCYDVSLSTSSQNVQFRELGNTESATIPEQCSIQGDQHSKNPSSTFSKSHFQQYSSHNQQGKLL